LGLLGFNAEDLDRWTAPAEQEGLTDADDVPPVPETPVTQKGDLWVLGNHRLLCGDSTNADDVARLLDGAVPFLMATDPPYGVAYDPKWRQEAGLADGGRTGVVANDHRVDWTDAYKLFPGDVAYVWHAGRFAGEVASHLNLAGFEIRCQIIWRKPRFAISRGHYHWGHEPAWYAVREGRTSKWRGDRKQSTVWDVALKDDAFDSDHGTQKPTECMARPIRHHGGAEDGVYDPFCGSGTTLIAAERLGRRCWAMELEPGYCDVIVTRWEQFTGKKAERVTATAGEGQ
jgi:DNA modification methylase